MAWPASSVEATGSAGGDVDTLITEMPRPDHCAVRSELSEWRRASSSGSAVRPPRVQVVPSSEPSLFGRHGRLRLATVVRLPALAVVEPDPRPVHRHPDR